MAGSALNRCCFASDDPRFEAGSYRPIHVLETCFTQADRQLDIFANNQMVRATQWAFMLSFASEISQPILPGDEHLEYVPAQVGAEYLTNQPVRWRGG